MNQIAEAARTTDVVHETDLLVVGSGPGGLTAAPAAARAGARTTLLDRNGCLGGNITPATASRPRSATPAWSSRSTASPRGSGRSRTSPPG